MTHPPIPPNCDWFGTYDDGEGFCNLPVPYGAWKMPLVSIRLPHWRAFVAVTARCSWKDAPAHEVAKYLRDELRGGSEDIDALTEQIRSMMDTAWKAWGEQTNAK